MIWSIEDEYEYEDEDDEKTRTIEKARRMKYMPDYGGCASVESLYWIDTQTTMLFCLNL